MVYERQHNSSFIQKMSEHHFSRFKKNFLFSQYLLYKRNVNHKIFPIIMTKNPKKLSFMFLSKKITDYRV
ncbi:hypothetical protein AOE57_01130 [Candidatus Riesia pediculicola]|nr:hypothetical protein AOE57_01130 [Candidatus Riesia pediculicola]